MPPCPLTAPESAAIAATIDALRAGGLRVHAITSPVAAERTANTLLALDIRPTLSTDPDEVEAFVAGSDALLINLGMMDDLRRRAIPRAIATAARLGKPWVLDPVFVEVSPARKAFAAECLAQGPAVLKTNGSEALFSTALAPATVRVVTGPEDRIRLGDRSIVLGNGHPLAARVTAMGCALGAVIAAACAASSDTFLAATSAIALYGVAGDRAGAGTGGPGSFAMTFYDALAALDGAAVVHQMRPA